MNSIISNGIGSEGHSKDTLVHFFFFQCFFRGFQVRGRNDNNNRTKIYIQEASKDQYTYTQHTR